MQSSRCAKPPSSSGGSLKVLWRLVQISSKLCIRMPREESLDDCLTKAKVHEMTENPRKLLMAPLFGLEEVGETEHAGENILEDRQPRRRHGGFPMQPNICPRWIRGHTRLRVCFRASYCFSLVIESALVAYIFLRGSAAPY